MSNFAFLNCNVLDGVNASVLPDMTILVGGGRIAGIGKSGTIKVPTDFRSIDLGGKYVMPGLINAHVHLALSGKPMKLSAAGKLQDRALKFMHTGLGRRILEGMMKKNVAAEINSGVTTSRCVGDLLYLDIKLRDMIASGKLTGPRLLVSGPVITPTGGHGQAFGLISDSPWEVRKNVRKIIHHQPDLIKICSTGGVTDARKLGEAGRLEMTPEEISAACEEAHKAGLQVASHAQSTEGIRLALSAGVDTIEHGAPLDDELVELFLHNPKALNGYSCLIPTLSPAFSIGNLDSLLTYMKQVNIKNSEVVYKGMIEGIQRATAAGIKVGVGTDASTPFTTHYGTWRELVLLVKYAGLSPMQAIINATRVNAEILGIDTIAGTLEKGKSADLIVVEKNPLEDLTALSKVHMVMAGDTFIEKPEVKTFPKVEAALDSILSQDGQ